MSIVDRFQKLIQDPPPACIFEISPGGIAWSVEGRTGWNQLPSGVLNVNPLADNVLDAEILTSEIRRIVPASSNSKKRRPCAVILPDYCSRLTVLDFDSLPSKPEEQASLIRFRVKKSLPFDVDAAALSFHVQNFKDGRKEVVVAAVSLEILSRYEAAFRAAGLLPGFVTISSLAMMDLVEPCAEMTLVARLNGRVLTLAGLDHGILRLVRCVEVDQATQDEVAGVVIPTIAFVEDECGKPVAQVLTCGMESFEGLWPADLKVEALPSQSTSAGLTGYLRALSN
jgi:type IV pilus assembly protein PilM